MVLRHRFDASENEKQVNSLPPEWPPMETTACWNETLNLVRGDRALGDVSRPESKQTGTARA